MNCCAVEPCLNNREFKKLLLLLQQKCLFEIEFCTRWSILQLFHVGLMEENKPSVLLLALHKWFSWKGKEWNIHFTAGGCHCQQNTKKENFAALFGILLKKETAPKSVRHVHFLSHVQGSFATPSPSPFNVAWGKRRKNSVQDWTWTRWCPTLNWGGRHLKSEECTLDSINARGPKKFVEECALDWNKHNCPKEICPWLHLNPIVVKVVPEKPMYAPEKSAFHPNMTWT